MKIWQVCMDPGIPVGGTKGSSIHVLSIARALASLGHDVLLFCARVADGFQAPSGVRVVCAAQDQRLRKTMTPSAYGLSLNTPLNDLLAQHSSREGLPDFIYERYSLWSRAAADFAARAGVPFLLEVNSPLIDEERTYRALESEGTAREIEQTVYSKSQTIFTVSPPLSEYVRSRCGSCHVECIPNGVDLSWVESEHKNVYTNDVLRIGFVGSLRPWHGLATLMRAAALLPARGYRIDIAGDGPMRDELKAQAQELGIDGRLVWHGAMPHDEIASLLDEIDVAVAPYPEIIPFYFSPIKLFEYGARGKAVICSRVGYLPSLFSEREILFIAPDAPERLAEAIIELSRNKTARDELGRNLREKIRRTHTWQKIAQQIIDSVGVSAKSLAEPLQ